MAPSRTLPAVSASSIREPHGDPVRAPPVLEVEHLRALPLGLEGREDALESRELLRERAVAEPDLEPLRSRPQRRPVLRVDVDLRDRGAPNEAALRPAGEQGERGLGRRAPVSESHIDAEYGTTLWAGPEGLEVRLGHGALPEKLARLERVLAALEAEGQRAEVLHLENRRRPDWVAVRLAGGVGDDGRERPRGRH